MAPRIEAAVEEFILSCQADGLSPNTVRWYRSVLKPLLAHYEAQPVDRLDSSAMRQYIVDLRTQNHRYQGARYRRELPGPMSIFTVRGHMRALRRFFNWCEAEYNLANPMSRIRMPRAPRPAPKAIRLEDLQKLIQGTTTTTQVGLRDRAMLLFLADTGCRAAGLLTLRMENLNIDKGRAIVQEKGDRARVVPFTKTTAEVLRAWLDFRPPHADTVFCSLSSGYYGKPLTLSGLWQVLKRLKEKTGVTGRVNPHSFRHGFARQYLSRGGDLATLAQLMGHSSIEVTTIYGVFSDDELAERHEQFSPVQDLEVGDKHSGGRADR
jgi:site-specific recombinase XerD